MDVSENLTLEQLTQELPPLSQSLRDLYRDARGLRHTDLYALARLARIADEAEYFLHQWPAAHWPAGTHRASPVPRKQILLGWLPLSVSPCLAAPGRTPAGGKPRIRCWPCWCRLRESMRWNDRRATALLL